MTFLKWLSSVLAGLLTLASITSVYASVWVVDAQVSERLSNTAFMSFILALGFGWAAVALWLMEEDE